MSRFHSDLWSIEVPNGWNAGEDESCATFLDAGGALLISATKRLAALSEFDLKAFANEHLGGEGALSTAYFGRWAGWYRSWSESGHGCHAWLLRSQDVCVHAKYVADLSPAAPLDPVKGVLSTLRSAHETPGRLTAGKAVLIGLVIVDVPLIALVVAFPMTGAILQWELPVLLLLFLVGVGVAWLWWAISVPRWRMWALNRGAPVLALQRSAQAAGLVLPKGHVLERTELGGKHRPPW